MATKKPQPLRPRVDRSTLDEYAKAIITKTRLDDAKEIYRAEGRNVIFRGVYQGKLAVLKVYDDHRINNEPQAQELFLQANQSSALKAPQVYAWKIESIHRGWLIMEELTGGRFLDPPLNGPDKDRFLRAFVEYTQNFPAEPTRPLSLPEQLGAADYHTYRINRWLGMAAEIDADRVDKGKPPLLDPGRLRGKFTVAINLIRTYYDDQPMRWGHGHVKPQDVYWKSDSEIYLTDFGHTKMHPAGYEAAFVIWADWFTHGDCTLPYSDWRQGVVDWLDRFREHRTELRLEDFDELLRISLVERTLGTILADLTAHKWKEAERRQRYDLMFNLLDELLAGPLAK